MWLHDNADADLLYGMMRLSNLVELDLSRNKSPEELQKHLMVLIYTLLVSYIESTNRAVGIELNFLYF